MGGQSNDTKRPVYSIGAVSRMLEVPTSTLRSWEERYGLVVPERGSGSQRVYSREQVAHLAFVAEQVRAGIQAGEAHRMLEAGHDLPILQAPEPGGGDRTGVLILLAERDPFAAELAEYLLKTEGYDVMIALDVADAVACSEQRHLDLAIVELMISGTRGAALCRDLHAQGVAVVATSVLDLRAVALGAGAEAFLPKPFDALQLVSTVRDLLGASALTRGVTQGATR